MPEMTVSEARAHLADAVDRVRVNREPVLLTRHGKPVAALIDHDALEQLIRDAEDLADIVGASEARQEMADTGESAIPWEDVKADLGLK